MTAALGRAAVLATAAPARAAVLATAALALAGCGGGSSHSEFSWLRPGPAPAGWHATVIPSGASLSVPPGWRVATGDRGTATAILYGSGHRITGYLNITPRQGTESPSNWTAFRLEHNREEGDIAVRKLAAGGGLRFRSGRGSCVRDQYTTSAHTQYIELACIVTGTRATTVIVGAAPPGDWPRVAPQLERAISALQT